MKTSSFKIVSILLLSFLTLTAVTAGAEQDSTLDSGKVRMMNDSGMHTHKSYEMMQNQWTQVHDQMKIMRDLFSPAERLDMMDKIFEAKSLKECREVIVGQPSPDNWTKDWGNNGGERPNT